MDTLEKACRELLRALGKALNDTFMYKPGHPTAKESAEGLRRQILATIQSSGEVEVVLALDKDNLLANGKVVAKTAEVPPATANFFQRLRLHSISFADGLTFEECETFLELARVKNEDLKDFDAAAWLQGEGVARVRANTAKYAIVDSEAPPVALPDAPGEEVPTEWLQSLNGMTLENQILAIIKRAIKDPELQRQVFEAVMKSLQSEIEDKVKRATAELEKQKQVSVNEAARSESVFDQISSGVVTVDDAGNILHATPEAEELAGKSLKDLAGKDVASAAQGEHYVAIAKDLGNPADRDISRDVSTVGNDNIARTLKASTAVLKNTEGKVVGIMATMPELTKFKELDRMQQEFVASITHEIRAPLTSIISALSILEGQLSGRLDKEQDRVLLLASKNANRLSDLVTEILDFQRIQSGHMSVHVATAEAEYLVQEATEGMSAWAKVKGIDLVPRCAPGLPPALADHKRTVQVLTNLLSNALKFTPSGGRIWVNAEKGQGDLQGFIVFSVKDTGRGIAKEDQEKIFEKFVQIAAAQKKIQGTGLGLSISKYLVYLQKGKMWVESEMGKGATFFFTLPMDIPPLTLNPSTTAKRSPTSSKQTDKPASPKGEKKGFLGKLFGS